MESLTKNQIVFGTSYLLPAIAMIGRWSYFLHPENSLPHSQQEKYGVPIFDRSFIRSLCIVPIVMRNTQLVCSPPKDKKGIELELNQPS
jgi:hypothetical protein